jgi:hypothetical protein
MWSRKDFHPSHQEKHCLVGYNSPLPKWVSGALCGDKQINGKCHFIMIETQEVITVTAFTDTLRAGSQKQTIQGKCIVYHSPVKRYHSQTRISLLH